MDLSTILLANRLIFHFRMAQMERRKKNGAKERGEPKFDRSTVKTEVLKLSLWCKQQHASDLVYHLQHQIEVRQKNRKYLKGNKNLFGFNWFLQSILSIWANCTNIEIDGKEMLLLLWNRIESMAMDEIPSIRIELWSLEFETYADESNQIAK